MRVHLIAIGGAVMHNLALALKHKGYEVTGSDDVIFSPAKERLEAEGLLPIALGWSENNISSAIDLVILGMHAKADNPELLKAQAIGLPIFSFPAFIFEHAKEKTRLVIAGSHGKTTTTALVMHCLRFYNYDFDYLVGSQLEGFERMVSLTEAPIMVIEGDEYLSSAIDPKPKFLHYHAHASVITGIEWDHINVFPTLENYVNQFNRYTNSLHENAALFVHSSVHDNPLFTSEKDYKVYDAFDFSETDTTCTLHYQNIDYPLSIFGAFNIQNIRAAAHLCEYIGISIPAFLTAIQSFKGTKKRQEAILKTPFSLVFKDFAHSPSKVKATIAAIRQKFKNQKLIAVLELHTYSSLQENFIPFYQNALEVADFSALYIDDAALVIKGKERPNATLLSKTFPCSTNCYALADLQTFFKETTNHLGQEQSVWIWMSSGHFGGLDIASLPYK
jgi:UDP-N-acetylmuramate: L-alanyl-gamma-D-glutamyl-meso-diaminopimelate ligase